MIGSKDIVKKYANKPASFLLKDLGYSYPPYDPFDIAKKLDITIIQNLTPENVKYSSHTNIYGDDNIVIWINPLDNNERQRFSLAHQLGHLTQHMIPHSRSEIYDTPRTIHGLEDGEINISIEMENEAMLFCQELLMPSDDVFKIAKEIFNKNKKESMIAGDLMIKLIPFFEVTKPVISVRLKELGITDGDGDGDGNVDDANYEIEKSFEDKIKIIMKNLYNIDVDEMAILLNSEFNTAYIHNIIHCDDGSKLMEDKYYYKVEIYNKMDENDYGCVEKINRNDYNENFKYFDENLERNMS